MPAGLAIPVFYFVGGTSDVAFAKANDEFKSLGGSAWKGNLPAVGHDGTCHEVNGGKFGVAASYWSRWVVRGDARAGNWFTDRTMAKSVGWEVESKALLNIHANPM